MLRINTRGDNNKTTRSLRRLLSSALYSDMHSYGRMGVEALSAATPVDTGETALAWDYRIKRSRRGASIEWFNTHGADETSVAVLIQYGHGTGTGGYVQGRDYINPAMRPIFDKIADDLWKKVRS